MKKFVKIVAALILISMIAMACNSYVCPAYADDDQSEQNDGTRS